MTLRVVYVAIAVVALHLGSPVASAQKDDGVPARRMGVSWDEDTPHLTFSARDLINADARRKLESGLPQTIVMRIYAYGEGGGQPITIAPLKCRVAYDLWQEVYRVQRQTRARDRSELVGSIEEVLERCLVARDMPVGDGDDYRDRDREHVHFAVVAEFNPLSPDTVQRIRRWLARPTGGAGFEGEAFFGSFVSLFVTRRIGDAERVIRFRSQNVTVP